MWSESAGGAPLERPRLAALRRRLPVKLGVLAGSTALSLLSAELLLRTLQPPRNAFCVQLPNLSVTFDPTPGVMPGVTGPSTFSTNSLGIRGDELTAGHDYRILALGGSTTECTYLDDGEAWPRALQENLNRLQRDAVVWVGNVGRSGINTGHHVLQVEALLRQGLGLDAVILMIGVNDLLSRLKHQDFSADTAESPGQRQAHLLAAFAMLDESERSELTGAPVELLRALRLAYPRWFDPPESHPRYQDAAGQNYIGLRNRRRLGHIRSDPPDLSGPLQAFAVHVNRIIDLVKAAGVRVIFATQPTMWRADLPPELGDLLWMGHVGSSTEFGQDYYSAAVLASGMDAYNARLQEICRERGVECVDLAATVPKDDRAFYDDCHLNENGARLVAEALADHLHRRTDWP